MTVWRITQEAYAGAAHEGLGGLHAAGRWHERGLPIIYASAHPSTALLELLVNTSATRLKATTYRVIEIRIPTRDVVVLPAGELPSDWRALPHPASTRQIGTEWITAERSVAMSVPSMVLPLARNVLINPSHSSIEEVTFGEPQALEIDPRLTQNT